MTMEESVVKSEQSYVELTACSTENLSPYSTASGYSDQSSYCQPDYDWHQQHQHQHYHHHEQQQQQQHHHQQPHGIPNPQLTDLSRQYYSTYPETHELTPVGTYPAFPHPSIPQGEFYNPGLWHTSQSDYIPATSLTSAPRLFSGIDMSQHAPACIPPTSTQVHQTPATKPKRKRVQSFTQRKAANVRERRRMFHLNEAFDELRKRLPAFNYEKRLSRIETLRLAMTYISFMKDVSVGEDPKCVKLKPHGLDLSSPDQLADLMAQDVSHNNAENHKLSSLSTDYSDSSNNAMSIHNGVH